MARKSPPAQQRPEPTRLTESVESARAKLQERIDKGEELLVRQTSNLAEVERLLADQRAWSDYDHTLLRRLFTTDELMREYSYASGGLVASFGPPSAGQKMRQCKETILGRVDKLKSIISRLELYADEQAPATSTRSATASQEFLRAFVVHGRDDAAKESVARFLTRLGVDPVILHEQSSSGMTVIEKLEHYSDVPFAVVLLTPDDEGRLAGGGAALAARARQNVILELGYFVGKLGRKNVCALFKQPVEVPSDWDGVVWVPMDDHEGWKTKLARELRAAGFAIDGTALL